MSVSSQGKRWAIVVGVVALVASFLLAYEGYRAREGVQSSVDRGLESRRVDALLIARMVEHSSDANANDSLREALRLVGSPTAAALYVDGALRASATRAEGGDAVGAFPVELGLRHGIGDRPIVQEQGADTLTTVRLDNTRVLALTHRGGGSSPWLRTLVAYQILTIVVLIASVGFIAWGVRRRGRSPLDAVPLGDAPLGEARREADFVVETFQSVIGELQVKGRELEQARRRERERAERSELFSERVIAQLPSGLAVISQSGKVTAANPTAREIFPELPDDRTAEIKYSDAFRAAPELVEMIGCCLQDGSASNRLEVELRDAEQDPRWLGVSVSGIATTGERHGALCLVTDLTEVIALRNRLQTQENLASLGEMAAGLAHELKNSLATIQGYGQLLAQLVPANAGEPSDALVAEVRQLTQMVTDFLNFARPQNPVLSPVKVREVIDATVARFDDAVRREQIALTVSCPGDLEVSADEVLLSRAILNLLQNAIEALSDGVAPKTIGLQARRSDGREWQLEVRDSGPGIPRDLVSKIFIPFFTTKERGHGIGLALTERIIFSHGGRISVESDDSGTAFKCVLPLHPSS